MRYLDVLFIQREWNHWRDSRFWSFGAHLALAEGLRYWGVRCTVTTEDRLSENKNMFGKRRFDQIWFNDLVHIKRDDAWFRWLASFAPVRIGLLVESLNLSPEEIAVFDELRTRKADVTKRIKYMTHVLACDERDASEIDNEEDNVRAIWTPFSVPQWAIKKNEPDCQIDKALFLGTLYGKRKEWINNPTLASVLVRPKSLEDSTVYPILFDVLRRCATLLRVCNSDMLNAANIKMLIHIRKKCYSLYLESLSGGCAVVNFPHFVKTYSPRVVEGIAVGLPVISWEIPERPLNKRLFEDGHEILLYPMDDLEQLEFQIQRVLKDRNLRRQITQCASKKVQAFHTTEQRIRQVLRWIESGDVPIFN